MITIQNADAALKDYYLDAFTAQLNNNICPFFSAIEKNTDNVSGKEVKLAIARSNAGGIMGGSEDSDLPNPHKNRYVNISVPLKNFYGTIEISDKAMRASRESAGAFVNLVNAEMEGLVASAKENFRRMLFGDGSGLICALNERVNSKTYKVDSAKPYLDGMLVDIYVEGVLKTGEKGIYITNIDPNENRVTFSEDISDSIKSGEVYVHGSKDGELTGLFKILFGEDLYGIDKKNDIQFSPHIVDAAGEITVEKLCGMIDFLEEHANSKVNMILCSYKTRRLIASLSDESRRIVNSIDVHTGYGAITVNNVPVFADKYCLDDVIYFLNTDDFALYQLCDWEWLEDEDGKILKQIPGKAAYSATLVKYAELICRKPAGQGAMYCLP